MHHTQGINPSVSLAVVSCVLFVHDYALTLAKEIDLFWLQPRQTWAFAFFVANRYIGLFGRTIPELWGVFFGSSDSPWCPGLLISNRVITAVLQLIGGMIMLARVYAFYNKDRRVPSLLIAVGVVCLALCGWALSYHRPPPTSKPTATARGAHSGCHSLITSVEASRRLGCSMGWSTVV